MGREDMGDGGGRREREGEMNADNFAYVGAWKIGSRTNTYAVKTTRPEEHLRRCRHFISTDITTMPSPISKSSVKRTKRG